MTRFYVKHELASGLEYSLDDEVVRHIQVLRYREQDKIILFNGNGCDYPAVILQLARREVLVRVLEQQRLSNEAPLQINLLMSVIANDKMDMVIQKAVELGVCRIVPVFSARCQRLKTERIANRMEHWQKIIISACEQSGRAVIPQLVEPQELDMALKNANGVEKLILSPHHETEKFDFGQCLINCVDLLVGPEGGFSENEIQYAGRYSFKNWQLGQRILRAETAAIAGISILQANLGDFNC